MAIAQQEPKVRQYDLETRTLTFARNIRQFIRKVPKTPGNFEDSSQLIRSSGSVGANYIEANEALSKKDFAMRIKICRKEAKESTYWLQLLDPGQIADVESERQKLQAEARELEHIFGAILRKVTSDVQ